MKAFGLSRFFQYIWLREILLDRFCPRISSGLLPHKQNHHLVTAGVFCDDLAGPSFLSGIPLCAGTSLFIHLPVEGHWAYFHSLES